MLELYHADTAVCAAKVRVVLAEKGLAYEGHLMDLGRGDQFAPDYMKLNPSAVVPTLVHDGAVITESTVICEYLDEVFAPVPLRPQEPLGRFIGPDKHAHYARFVAPVEPQIEAAFARALAA